jgi:hypothetical protein
MRRLHRGARRSHLSHILLPSLILHYGFR